MSAPRERKEKRKKETESKEDALARWQPRTSMGKMVKEGKIAVPPGGSLEKGSLISMFLRMLIHNAMEEQARQEALDKEDEDE